LVKESYHKKPYPETISLILDSEKLEGNDIVMNLQGQTLLNAPRERVWAALNDPAVLARCIDGVETLERVADNRFEGAMNVKVGPVRARFTGTVELTEIDPPNSYVIVGEGKGGMAGFAKGKADVRLADQQTESGSAGTLLSYTAQSTVGGKLAQLGARLVEGAARTYAESFFGKLKDEVEGGPAEVPVEAIVENIASAQTRPEPSPASDSERGLPPVAWGALIAIAVILLITWLVW
jgi:carbon monoxide dehydrogenase subunit G